MNESLARLLEKMRASRAALAQQLEQISTSDVRPTALSQKTLAGKGVGIAIAAVLGWALLFRVPARRHVRRVR
jgi:hypothetical protein